MLSKTNVNMQQEKTNVRDVPTTTAKPKMELAVTTANGFKPSFFFTKSSILDYAVVPEALLNDHCNFKRFSTHFSSLEF